jgi:hypothetical protein
MDVGCAVFGLAILIERTYSVQCSLLDDSDCAKGSAFSTAPSQSVYAAFLDSRALANLGCRTKNLAGDALVKEQGRVTWLAPWRITALPLSGQPRFQRYLGLRGVITPEELKAFPT